MVIHLSTSQIVYTGKIDGESEDLTALISALQKVFKEDSRAVIKETKVHPSAKTRILGEYYYGVDKSTRPLEWLVLEEKEDRELLITKNVIDNINYHNDRKVLSWRDCSLRTWLNTVFIHNAFTESEQDLLLETERSKTQNSIYDTEDDPECSDKLFLFSAEEVKQYLSVPNRIGCMPTAYAKEKGVFTSVCCLWWLRTPGDEMGMQTYVNAGAAITYDGCYQQRREVGLRPAVWVKKTG